MRKARAAEPDRVGPPESPEPLAGLDYARELEIKNAALQEFWQEHNLPDKPNRILPSPKPRHYRITTKRRVISSGPRVLLDFHADRPSGARRMGAASELEPPEHKAIYAFLLEKLNQESYEGLARALNFLIIRGDYTRFSVFFNVHRLNAGVARKAKLLAEHLTTFNPSGPQMESSRRGEAQPPAKRDTAPRAAQGVTSKVLSAFLFFDPARSSFYLDQRAPDGPWKLKRLFGPENLRLEAGGREYVFGPTSFSQVNGSILGDFLEKADQLLKPKNHQRLLDLYCGFGFFSLKLAPQYADCLGVEASSASIEAAQAMAAHGKIRSRYRQGKIQSKTLDALLPKPDGTPEAILLDPPRQGAEPGVIRALASRAPVRVLHVFCDLDVLPREVNVWRKCGYMISKVVPLDMFPGTDNLEVMVLFIPDRYGILNRVPRQEVEFE